MALDKADRGRAEAYDKVEWTFGIEGAKILDERRLRVPSRARAARSECSVIQRPW
jgi:hypothetical protein